MSAIKNRYIVVLLFHILLILSCRKYPENTLWCRNPEKVFKGGRLKYLKVNNIDSLPFFNSYFGFNANNELIDYDHLSDQLSSFHFKGNLTILKKSDKVGLYLHLSDVPQNNNKVSDFSIYNFCEWKIQKYTKTGELKLKTEKNGKIYEVLFDN